jgi:hypothetical protein
MQVYNTINWLCTLFLSIYKKIVSGSLKSNLILLTELMPEFQNYRYLELTSGRHHADNYSLTLVRRRQISLLISCSRAVIRGLPRLSLASTRDYNTISTSDLWEKRKKILGLFLSFQEPLYVDIFSIKMSLK